MTRRIAIEIETSGLDPNAGAEIIMVCALELLDRKIPGKVFHKLIKPSRNISSAVEEFTGISNAMLNHAPRFVDISDDLLSFANNSHLVCIDWNFNRNFINRALIESGRPLIKPKSILDLWSKVPPKFRLQGFDGIYNYAAIKRDLSRTYSEEVSRLYWSLLDK